MTTPDDEIERDVALRLMAGTVWMPLSPSMAPRHCEWNEAAERTFGWTKQRRSAAPWRTDRSRATSAEPL